jgi:hypothetical protein
MTLTEQLKKGELEQGYYYMQIPTGDIRIITECMKVDCKGFSILSKVPSYEEWKELKDEVEIYHNNFKLMKAELERELENQQLKKLLKECRSFFIEGTKCSLVSYHKNDLFMMLEKIDNAIGEK